MDLWDFKANRDQLGKQATMADLAHQAPLGPLDHRDQLTMVPPPSELHPQNGPHISAVPRQYQTQFCLMIQTFF